MSADRIINKPIAGPDRSDIPTISTKTSIGQSEMIVVGFLPLGKPSNFGADRGFEDPYAPKEAPKPSNLQLSVNNTHLPALKSKDGDTSRSKLRGHGAELVLNPESAQGKATVFRDPKLYPNPLIAPIEGVEVTYIPEVSIGLYGRRERKIVLEGPNELVAKSLEDLFDIDPKAITRKSTIDTAQTAQPQSAAA